MGLPEFNMKEKRMKTEEETMYLLEYTGEPPCPGVMSRGGRLFQAPNDSKALELAKGIRESLGITNGNVLRYVPQGTTRGYFQPVKIAT